MILIKIYYQKTQLRWLIFNYVSRLLIFRALCINDINCGISFRFETFVLNFALFESCWALASFFPEFLCYEL